MVRSFTKMNRGGGIEDFAGETNEFNVRATIVFSALLTDTLCDPKQCT